MKELLTPEEHDYLVKGLGFKKVNTRCPVCYTENLIKNIIKELLENLAIEYQEEASTKWSGKEEREEAYIQLSVIRRIEEELFVKRD